MVEGKRTWPFSSDLWCYFFSWGGRADDLEEIIESCLIDFPVKMFGISEFITPLQSGKKRSVKDKVGPPQMEHEQLEPHHLMAFS